MKKTYQELLIVFTILIFSLSGFAQNVGINTTSTPPNVSAALDIDIKDKGLLIPRIPLVSASDAITIPSPAHSLLVYTIGGTLLPEGYYYNEGTPATPNWVPFLTNSAASSAGWSITGNSGTTPATNFIGTLDTQDWVIKTNNSERVRVLSGGNVGIGTTAPGNLLHLNGNLTLGSGSVALDMWGTGINFNNGVFQQQSSNISLSYNFYRRGTDSKIITLGGTDAYAIRLGDFIGGGASSGIGFYSDAAVPATGGDLGSPTLRMVLTNTGNFGIGSTTPAQKLDVSGNVKVGLGSQQYFVAGSVNTILLNKGVGNSTSGSDILFDTRGLIAAESNMYFNIDANSDETTAHFGFLKNTETDSGTELMRIQENGRVGIGISNPEELLIVNGAARFIGEALTDDGNQRVHIEIGTNSMANIAAATGPDRSFRILTETNLQASGRDWLVFEGLDANEAAQDGGFVFRSGSSTGAHTDVMIVEGRGNVGIGTNSTNYKLDVRGSIGNNAVLYHSDRRWKKNIQPIHNALEQVLLVDGKKYEWRRDEFNDMNFPVGQHYGVIAQEIEAIFPELVSTNKDGYKSVDYGHITPLLIEAIKELHAQNEEQKQIIEALKTEKANSSDVDQLKAEILEMKAILNQKSSR